MKKIVKSILEKLKMKDAVRFYFKKIKRLLLSLNWVFNKYLKKIQGYNPKPKQDIKIKEVKFNTTLKQKTEYEHAVKTIKELGLKPHPDAPKNWDSLKTFYYILENLSTEDQILDAGGATYSHLVKWLNLYGYNSLNVINPVFDYNFSLGNINYKKEDATDTNFTPETFDLIACLSVIEHGVDVDKFLQESFRILKPGGKLIISTDFWNEKIDTKGKEAYGVPIQIFSEEEVRNILEKAKKIGFATNSELSLKTKEKTVSWHGFNFTFVILMFKK